MTSLSLKAAALVMSLNVVPELAKSIGPSDELCSFPPVPTTSRYSPVFFILAPKASHTLIDAKVSSEYSMS